MQKIKTICSIKFNILDSWRAMERRTERSLLFDWAPTPSVGWDARLPDIEFGGCPLWEVGSDKPRPWNQSSYSRLFNDPKTIPNSDVHPNIRPDR